MSIKLVWSANKLCSGDPTYIAVRSSHTDCSNHKEPIRPWDVNLAMEDLRRMLYFNLWEV